MCAEGFEPREKAFQRSHRQDPASRKFVLQSVCLTLGDNIGFARLYGPLRHICVRSGKYRGLRRDMTLRMNGKTRVLSSGFRVAYRAGINGGRSGPSTDQIDLSLWPLYKYKDWRRESHATARVLSGTGRVRSMARGTRVIGLSGIISVCVRRSIGEGSRIDCSCK